MNDEIVDGEAVELVGQAVELRQAHPPTLFRSEEPGEIIARASETAKTLADVLKKQKLTTRISQRDHVRVEGWTLLGTMLGVFPVCVWTRKLENGWEARVEARTISGAIVGAAEAECLRSEKTWANRDDFALRSMAQTRATSKALRQPLGFVVSLAGFDPTPFEEMPSQDSGAGHSETREVTPKDSTPTDATSSERTSAEHIFARPRFALQGPEPQGQADEGRGHRTPRSR